MSNDFFTGLVAGVIATTVGFGLTMLWDIWKFRREESRRTNIILIAIEHELEENIDIIDMNRQLLDAENQILHTRHHISAATVNLKHEIWGLLKINLPDKILKKSSLIKKLRDVEIIESLINEGLTSRQNYRDASSHNTAFSQSMKHRNDRLIEQMDKALSLMHEVLPEIRNIRE